MSETSVSNQAAPATPPPFSWKMGVLFLFAVLVSIGAMFAVVSILRVHFSGVSHAPGSPAHTDAADHPPETKAHSFTHPYELKKMSIALTDAQGNAGTFAQFTLVLDCPSEASRHWIEVSRSMIRDAVYETASDFRVEHFSNTDGYSQFREHLLQTLRDRMGDQAPSGVSIEDWVLVPRS